MLKPDPLEQCNNPSSVSTFHEDGWEPYLEGKSDGYEPQRRPLYQTQGEVTPLGKSLLDLALAIYNLDVDPVVKAELHRQLNAVAESHDYMLSQMVARQRYPILHTTVS